MKDILNMGGYGAYVWTCYGLSLIGLCALAWMSRRSLIEARRTVERRAQMESST
jgi:heme exporter protein CcmD